MGTLRVRHQRLADPRGAEETAQARIREGLRFVFGHPLIIGAIALDMFAVLFGGAVEREDLRLLAYLGETREEIDLLEEKVPRLLGLG